MKLRSLEELNSSLNDCLSWRKHELKNLQSFFSDRDKPLTALVKASLLLTYAHWEGGVKDSATRYLRHVEQQKQLRRNLKSNFLALESISAIKTAAASSQIFLYQQVVDHVRYNLDHRYRLPNIALVDPESNLSSKVFRNILSCLGLDAAWTNFETKQRLIDVALLKARNDIAHTGQTEDRADIDLAPVLEDVLSLLEQFKTELENAAAQKLYLETLV